MQRMGCNKNISSRILYKAPAERKCFTSPLTGSVWSANRFFIYGQKLFTLPKESEKGRVKKWEIIFHTPSLILLYLYMEIHPNAFATELISIMTANTGHRYWTMIWNTLFLWNFPSPWSTSSSIRFMPMTLDTRRQVAMAAIGIMTEFVRKSKKSRNCIPMMVTLANGP